MKKKKVLYVVLALLLIASISIMFAVSYAFFTSNDRVDNTFVMGEVKISLDEPSWDLEDKGRDLIPGTCLNKDPYITELEGESYARIIVQFIDSDTKELITDKERLNAIRSVIYYDKSYDVNRDLVTTNLIEGSSYSNNTLKEMVNDTLIIPFYNYEMFILDESRSHDGYFVFNCQDKLNKGDRAVLFTNIVIPTDYVNSDVDLLGKFEIKIFAEAIQTFGFVNRDAAFLELDKGVK